MHLASFGLLRAHPQSGDSRPWRTARRVVGLAAWRVCFAAAAFAAAVTRGGAQAADEVTGVSVAIKLFGLSWTAEPSNHLTVAIDALNGHASTDADGADSETPQVLARLAVGKSYTLSLSQSGLNAANVMAVAPPGHTMEIDGVPREQHTVYSPMSVRLRVRPPADAAPPRAGVATSLGTERTLWQASLGSLSNGESAGAIGFIDIGQPGTIGALFHPGGLIYDSPSSEVLVLVNHPTVPAPYVPGTLRQIIAPQVVVNVHMDALHQCQIQFYHRAQLASAGTDGIYTFSGDPFAWYFFNPHQTVPNAVKITCGLRNITDFDVNGRPILLPPLQPVVRTKVTVLERTGTAPNHTWTASDWFEDGGATLSRNVRARNALTELITTSAPGGAAERSLRRTYAGQAWGDDVVTEELGTTNSITTSFDYWTSPGAQSAAYSRLRSVLRTGGHWEAYEYFDYADGIARAGALSRRHRPFKNSDLTVPSLASHGGEITHFTWAPDTFGRATRLTQMDTTVNGIATARTTISYAPGPAGLFPNHPHLHLVVATRNDYSAAGAYLTTITKYFREDAGTAGGAGADDFFRLQVHSVQQPDGVKQSFAYQRGTWSSSGFAPSPYGGLDAVPGVFASRVSVITGSASAGTAYTTHDGYDIDDLGLIDGKSTQQVTIRDNYARIVRTESYVRHTNAWHLVGAVNFEWNYSNQLIRRARNDSAAFNLAAGAIQEAAYHGERLVSSVEESGIALSYTYDTADRLDVVTKAGIGAIGPLSTKFLYDAAGQITRELVGYGQTEQIISSRTFDDAGRIGTESVPGPNGSITSTYVYAPGLREIRMNSPLGRNQTHTLLADGRLEQVGGTMRVAESYTYEIQAGGTRYTRVNLGTGTSRLREMWSDWLGRTTKTSRPGFTGQPPFVEQFTFDSVNGRLKKTSRHNGSGSLLLADVLYDYDALSQVTSSGLDMGNNGFLDPASNDRIGAADQYCEYTGNAWWLTRVERTYPTAGSAAALTTATTRQRLTGFAGNLRAETVAIDADGNTTTQTVSVDRSARTTTVSTTTSGLTNPQIEVSLNGLPTSVTRPDGLTYSIGYDSLHRRSTSTAPRTGTTTTVYKPGSTAAAWVRDPLDHVVASYAYDAAGRVVTVTDAAGRVTRFAYNERDQVERRWGDAVHPIELGYNALGERVTLKTFRGGSGWDGITWPTNTGAADWTRWELDGSSGLLREKYDAANLDSSGVPIANAKRVVYTYNARGQPATRTWARGTSVTYGYDGNTGELLSQTYGDGTPAIGYTYTRAGQVSTATDGTTGTRTFNYGTAAGSHALQLDWIALPAYYNGRRLTRQYDGIKRASGFQLGMSGTPDADLSQTHAYRVEDGRFHQIATRNGTQSPRTIQYHYFQFNSDPNQPRAPIVGGYATDGLTVAHDYEPNRDLLTATTAIWGGTARTRYDYTYNSLGQRVTAKQSGSAFTGADDFGGSTYYRYVYGTRGELTEAVNYFGEDPSSTSSPQLVGRRFGFAYDHAGNRQSATRALGTALSEVFTPNALNQYGSRENDVTYAAGIANASSTISIAGATASAPVGRAGRYWAAELVLGNTSAPAAANLNIKATLAGNPTLERSENRTACLPKALQSFSYDADGNLTRDGVWVYRWDGENRLVEMFTCGSPEDPLVLDPASVATWNSGIPRRKLEFRYDYLGRRVQKRAWQWSGTAWAVTSERRFLYDGWDLVAEFEAPGGTSIGSIVRSYTWGLDVAGSLTATGGVGGLVQILDHASSTLYLPTYDGNGNVAALLRAGDGQVVAKYEYSPFGELVRCEGAYAQANPFRFSTKFTDAESALSYYGARFYSPSLGRFINRDPIEESGGMNLYGFAGNDGVNGFDYLGFFHCYGGYGDWGGYNDDSGYGGGFVISIGGGGGRRSSAPVTPQVVAAAPVRGSALPPVYGGLETSGPDSLDIAIGLHASRGLPEVLAKEGAKKAGGRLFGLNPLLALLGELLFPTAANAPGADQYPRVTIREGYVIPSTADPELVEEFFRLRQIDPRRARKMLLEIWNGTDIHRVFPARFYPAGFRSQEQFDQAVAELRAALLKSGITDGTIGVRGSSVTGISSNPNGEHYGRLWGPESDIDFYVESEQLTRGMKTSSQIPGMVHPTAVMRKHPELRAWAQKWSAELGRKISPAGYVPGTVPNTPNVSSK